MIKQHSSGSGAISSIEYDTESQTMDITFTDGSAYRYYGVPAYVYYEFIDSGSLGSYFNESFKPEDYSFVKVG
jgi:hypothetical protein